MIPIAFAFVINALWLIFSPVNELITMIVSIFSALFMMFLASYLFIKHSFTISTSNIFCSFIAIGIIGSFSLYVPALKEQNIIADALPKTITASFKIIQNHQATSTTIQIIDTHILEDHAEISPVESSTENREKRNNCQLLQALINSQIRIFNVKDEIKILLSEGEIYKGSISIRPRYYRNIPGDRQRILQSLAKKEIGYGRFEDTPVIVSEKSFLQLFRQQSSQYFFDHFNFGGYLSALSVGITKHLNQTDWHILRKTGTIHLVSISGLHLSLTAFYAFIIFRCIGGLLAFRTIPPFKFAAICSIIIAWNYALIAGMSLPTLRAAIMFTLIMSSLLINRALFSLHSISIALLIILILNPLSILQPGFWLSFIAVTILILSSRIFTSSLQALLFTQLVISLLLTPLTASFFGEISLISPLINLFAIPWTTTMVMPFLLLGTLFLPMSTIVADVFLKIADQSVYVLITAIQWSAKVPFASLQTERIPLIWAISITTISLFILYYYPRLRLLKSQYLPLFWLNSQRYITQCYLQWHNYLGNRLYSLFAKKMLRTIPVVIIINIMSLLFFMTTMPAIEISQHAENSQRNPENISEKFGYHHSHILHKSTEKIEASEEIRNMTQADNIHIYLLPVGEGLSLLFHSENLTFLFDTGNRFMNFDAGKQIILPTLNSLNINALDLLFLSLKNQQHIGGTRSIRTNLPKDYIHNIIAHQDLLWLLDEATDCRQLQGSFTQSSLITIQSIPEIQSSCAFIVTIANQVRLYLISDITESEWKRFQNNKTLHDSSTTDYSHEILLYPNQGRSHYPLQPSFFSSDIQNNIALFSTRKIHSSITNSIHSSRFDAVNFENSKNSQNFSKLTPNISAYNSYYGTIHLHLKISPDNKHAKPKTQLRIKNYADSERYWWLKL